MALSFADRVVIFLVAMPAIILHELAHGLAASALGDPTAREAGRLTLNPLRHVHPLGTVAVPAVLALVGAPVILGWAKPVPITPFNFRDYRLGMMLTALAGPGANLGLAAAAALGYRALGTPPIGSSYVAAALYLFCLVNVVLACVNLIPIPPLDGSMLMPVFLSEKGLLRFERSLRLGVLVIVVPVVLAPILWNVDLLGRYLHNTATPLMKLLIGM